MQQPPPSARAARPAWSVRPRPSRAVPCGAIATVLPPIERQRVDAAGEGTYVALHRDSLDEVVADLRAARAQAVLLSVAGYARDATAGVRRLVREFPQVPAFALLAEESAASPPALLALGQSGVRAVVDVRDPDGWVQLRRFVETLGQGIEQRAAVRVADALPGLTEDGRRFFETCFTAPPAVQTVRRLAHRLAVEPSTLMSRFHRAGLPAPRRYLSYARLVRAAQLFENPGLSVTQVAMRLEYSSPQSFGRHITGLLGLTAVGFRRAYDGERMLRRYLDELVVPYADGWAGFHPLLALPSWVGVPRRAAAAVRSLPRRPDGGSTRSGVVG